jgi:hypothetical protein
MAENSIAASGGGNNPRPHPDVLWRRLDDEVILMQLKTDRMFSLNRTGARLWELIAEGLPLDVVRARLEREFEVGQERLSAEIGQILELLAGEQLIVRGNR